MKIRNLNLKGQRRTLRFAALVLGLAGFASALRAADSAPAFDGEKSTWHDGFVRYDYIMDAETMAITPFTAPANEGMGVRDPAPGKRRCVVIAPKEAAPGNPWSWRGCYWDHQSQAEVELLRRGFHIAYISAGEKLRPDQRWDAWYAFLTEKHGLSPKPCFVGMSRGGEFEYTWATLHPDKVTCIYADNPGGNWGVMERLADLATNDVPVLHVCGSIDPILGRFTLPMEATYTQLGGRFSLMIKEGRGHHPHSLRDPKPIADFMEQSFKETKPVPPDFVDAKSVRTSYYSSASAYVNYPKEGVYVTLRGPLFNEVYNRYTLNLPGGDAFSTVIVPKKAAPGMPWIFRADMVDRDAAVDQALLARGFHIVTGAVGYNFDGPVVTQWNTIYKHLTDHGFSKKPAMEGNGGAAGEAYAWSIANPDKVSCIYAENAVMHSNTAKTQPLDNLEPLAKAGVPVLHDCGSLDPFLADNTRVLEKRYKELGGSVQVLVRDGAGHMPLNPADPQFVADFITKSSK